jgi:hypothetical protein
MYRKIFPDETGTNPDPDPDVFQKSDPDPVKNRPDPQHCMEALESANLKLHPLPPPISSNAIPGNLKPKSVALFFRELQSSPAVPVPVLNWKVLDWKFFLWQSFENEVGRYGSFGEPGKFPADFGRTFDETGLE